VSYTLADNVENLTLTGIDNLNATGNALDNQLTGNDGDNIIDGGAGADTMTGGRGNDTYYVDNSADRVVELSGQGNDQVFASASFVLSDNIENITLTGSANVNATGNALDNRLEGNSGNNVLDGGVGADTMIGGEGDDTYVVDNLSDVVTEAANQGADTVRSSLTYLLGNNLENLVLLGASDLDGTGNALANQITGNDGNNVLDGGASNDALMGGLGDDTLIGGTGADTLDGGGGSDTASYANASGGVVANLSQSSSNTGEAQGDVYINIANLTGSAFDDLLVGDAAANRLLAGAGNDTLQGGAGADTLDGGAGIDTASYAGSGLGVNV
ncbi:calcium-binding protein, partial [Roseateles sp. BYS180W]